MEFNRETLMRFRQTEAPRYRNGAPIDDVYQAARTIQEGASGIDPAQATDIALAAIARHQAGGADANNTSFSLLDAVALRAVAISEHLPQISIQYAAHIALNGCAHLLE